MNGILKKPKNVLSLIEKSANYPLIMEKYESVGVFMTIREFYNDYVSKMGEGITENMWYKFMAKYNRKIQIKTEELIGRAANKKVTETQMEESSVKKILAIADVTLDQVVSNPELLNGVPLADRMAWLFSSMKARDSRMVAVAKLNAENRKTNMYEDVLKAAQYGDIKEGEIADQGAIEPPKETVEFNPQDLE